MSQNPQKPKEKLVPKAHHSIVVEMPMVRNYSTGGGHGPEDTLKLIQRENEIVTRLAKQLGLGK